MSTRTTILPILLAVPVLMAADATIHVPETHVLDQELRELSCTLSEGEFLAGPAVIASLAGRKAALDACAADGAALRVRWTWNGDENAVIETVDANASLSTCVETALVAMPEAIEGRCEGVLLIGEPEAAEQAAARLGDKPESSGS